MKSKVLSLLFCCASLYTYSQKISGIVTDENGKPLPSVTISLLRPADSSALKFTISDHQGHYEFSSISKGSYLLSATSAGFQNSYSHMFEYKESAMEIPGIRMNAQKNELSAVTVKASKPFIEMHLDKMMINVDASPTNAGANALEVLAKSPTVNVDMDENISLNGKQGVLVLLDGKTTYLNAKDLATLLKSIPASSIDQIEIMNTPPAKYDAEGMAGVINIKTKKNRNDGLNGTWSSSLTTYLFNDDLKNQIIFNHQNNLSLNYRKQKTNINISTGLSSYKGQSIATYNKTYFAQDQSVNGYTFFIVRSKYRGTYIPINISIDYNADPKNIIGLSTSVIAKGGNKQTRDRTAEVWDGERNLISHYGSISQYTSEFHKTSANINWKHSIDTSGQEFSIDADMVRYKFPSEEDLNMIYQATAPNHINTYLHSNNKPTTRITALKWDYIKPFKGGKWEAGVKSGFIATNLDNQFFRLDNSKWISDSALMTNFTYHENITALYSTLEKHFKKWSLQGGLRLEKMHATGDENIKGVEFTRDNTALFPTLFSSYEINKNNTIKISYSRRINRPQFYALMPYLSVVDSLDIWHGNPNLKPEFSNRYEAVYSLQNKYFFTLGYTVTKDVIRFIAGQIGNERATEFYPINIDKYKSISLTIISPFTITKWWNISAVTNLFNNKYYNLQNGSSSQFYMTLNQSINQSFKLGQSLKGEMVLDYTTRSVDEISENDAVFNTFSLGLQKDILKQKGRLVLNCNDPFAWFHYSYRSHFIRMYEEGSYRFPTRSVTLSFTYQFGKVNNQNRQHNTASQEEQSR